MLLCKTTMLSNKLLHPSCIPLSSSPASSLSARDFTTEAISPTYSRATTRQSAMMVPSPGSSLETDIVVRPSDAFLSDQPTARQSASILKESLLCAQAGASGTSSRASTSGAVSSARRSRRPSWWQWSSRGSRRRRWRRRRCQREGHEQERQLTADADEVVAGAEHGPLCSCAQ